MKIVEIRKQIKKNLLILAIFAVGLFATVFFYLNQKNSVKGKIDQINREAAQINIELADLESRTAEITKYKEMWPKIPSEKKDVSGIKIDQVNSLLSETAAKYGIGNHVIKLSLPETVNTGVFERKTINVLMSNATLSFSSPSDVKALMFFKEFIESLKGYQIITSFSIEKTKDYKQDDLNEISKGKSFGYVEGKADFVWYVYKEKEGEENKYEEIVKKSDSEAAAEINNSKPQNESEVSNANN